MHTSTASGVSYSVANDSRNMSSGEKYLDCELVIEDQQGHHTFYANAEMAKMIQHFLATL